MSSCLQQAMKQTRFGIDKQGICNVFMVNEAEAAATYAISCLKHKLRVSQHLLKRQNSDTDGRTLARRDFCLA
jgi:hypothetical protein